MLDSVLHARDRWLAPGGHLLPDQAGMWLAGLDEDSGHAARVGYWDDVYGFRMSCMRQPVLEEAAVSVVPASSLLSNVASLREVAIATVTREDLQFDAPFQLICKRAATLTVSPRGRGESQVDEREKKRTKRVKRRGKEEKDGKRRGMSQYVSKKREKERGSQRQRDIQA